MSDLTDTHGRFRAQLKELQNALPKGVVALAGPEGAEEPNSEIAPAFAYLDHHILVPLERVERAVAIIKERYGGDHEDPEVIPPPRGFERIISVRRVRIGGRRVFPTVCLLARHGILATPVHFVSIAGGNLCPGDEPVPDDGPLRPPQTAHDHGAGVKVIVFDTGLVHDYLDHGWLAESRGRPHIPQVDGDVSAPGEELDGNIVKPYVGHGTFIAGVLRCVAPGAEVHVTNPMRYLGSALEDELGVDILRTLRTRGWPDIISLSAGTRINERPCRGWPSLAEPSRLLGLRDFVRELAEHAETLLVACAGNDGGTDRFWPAAIAGESPGSGADPMVVSVGALREDGQGRACFSNHGDWVQVYAPGERLTNAFLTGTYKYKYPRRNTCQYYPHKPLYAGCTCLAPFAVDQKADFSGIATWSGTSFSTPYVAGLIAAHMSQEKVGSRQAARKLLESRLGVPDLSAFLP